MPKFESLKAALYSRSAVVGIMGLGRVGLPLIGVCSAAGFQVIGFDIDAEQRAAAKSAILLTGDTDLPPNSARGLTTISDDFRDLDKCDVIVVCVQTPLGRFGEPDFSHIERAARDIAVRLRSGQLISIESTLYPGVTRNKIKPILEHKGRVCGHDFYLCYSPERHDLGNSSFPLTKIPKLVGGDGDLALHLAGAFYSQVVEYVHLTPSIEIAEAAKLTENAFRLVNIALVNELKIAFHHLDVDIWDVIKAAETKPFGYMPFYPGPGVGGGCVPVDPLYFAWHARESDFPVRLIEHAAMVNSGIPLFVIDVLTESLRRRFDLSIAKASVMVIGVGYKRNVSDVLESPGITILTLLRERGADVSFHDPYCTEIPHTSHHGVVAGLPSCELLSSRISSVDALIIVTDHDSINYKLISDYAKLIIDTRNIMERRGLTTNNVVKA